MQRALSSWGLGRLALAYVLVPLSGPSVLVLQMLLAGQRVPFFDRLGVVLLEAVFGLGAIAVLGTPLLFLYSRLHWTGCVRAGVIGE